jgi:hypothetical protein
LLEHYEASFAEGDASFAAAIATALPLNPKAAGLSSGRLASYLRTGVRQLERQPLASLKGAMLDFPKVAKP